MYVMWRFWGECFFKMIIFPVNDYYKGRVYLEIPWQQYLLVKNDGHLLIYNLLFLERSDEWLKNQANL